jgi:hypothetical protein
MGNIRTPGIRRWLILFSQFAAVSVTAADRDYPFMAASYTKVPESNFEIPKEGSDVETREYRLLLGLFEFGADNLRFDLGTDYQYTRYEYSGIEGRNRDLHRLQLPVGFDYRNRAWRLDSFIAPGVSTSSNIMKDLFDAGSGDDIIVTARLEATIDENNDLAWLAGLAYDRSFGEPVPYPVFGVRYRLRDQFRFRLAFPDSEFRYTPSPRQRLVVRLFPAGNEWHVFSEELNDDFDYEVKAWRARATWSLGFRKLVWIDLAAGYEFGRSHAFVDDAGRIIDADVENQFFATIGLRFHDAPIPYTNAVAR